MKPTKGSKKGKFSYGKNRESHNRHVACRGSAEKTSSLRIVAMCALAGILAFAMVGCGKQVSDHEIDSPAADSRFVSLVGSELPDEPLDATEIANARAEEEKAAETEARIETESEQNTSAAQNVVTVPPAPDAAAPSVNYDISDPVASVEPDSAPAATAPTGSSSEAAAPEVELDTDYTQDPNENTESYNKPDEQGFFSTEANPLSTFSADVDTASYANLRRMVEGGMAVDEIPDGAVRIEEMLNYFEYDFIQPTNDQPFALNAQIADCPWNDESKLMVLGIQAQALDEAAYGGSNLVFLIDTSGSMQGEDRLDLLKDAFNYLSEQLGEDDTVSIVTYAGNAGVALDGASGSDKDAITSAINNLSAGGSTNGVGGLQMAYELAEEHYVEGGNNRIIMASDGDLNVGITDTDDLNEYVSAKRSTGIYLSVLGFGTGNYKDDKMETLADNGNGNYHYIDSIEEAEKVFGEDLLANIVSIADDVKLQLEFDPAQVESYRLIGYENRKLNDEDFTDDTKDAAEMGAGHQAIVAYEVVLTDEAQAKLDSTSNDATTEEEAAEPADTAQPADPSEAEVAPAPDDAAEVATEPADTAQPADTADTAEPTDPAEAATDTAQSAEAADIAEPADAAEVEEAQAEDGAMADEWCSVSLRYKPAGEAVSKGIKFSVDRSAYTTDPDKDWVFISGLIEFGLIASDSTFTGSSSVEEALERTVVATNKGGKNVQAREEFNGLLETLIENG